jgi:hypothetical protein
LIKQIKIWTDNTYPLTNGRGGFKGQEIKLDYRLDNDTTWTEITGTAITSPTSTIDLGYGLAGKRIQIRIRLYSYNALETPVLLAAVIDAVSRSQVKYMYNLTYRLIDNEPSLTPRTPDEDSITAAGQSALSKLALLEAWADADTEGLLYMESNSPLYHGKYVFINPPATRQIALDPEPGRTWTGTAYVCSTTAQEA